MFKFFVLVLFDLHVFCDGGPSQKVLTNQGCNQIQVEVQEKVHILLASAPELDALQSPGFVHCIYYAKSEPMFNLFG